MSGDINTGMGNCLIMASIVLAYLDHVGCKAHLANNGDDCVLILERRDITKLSDIDEWFTSLGFKLTREPVVDVFERIEFCQSQPVLIGGAYRMVRNPWTAMSKDCVSLLSWDTQEAFNVWRDAIGVCGIELTRGVPVWESFYRRIKVGERNGGGTTSVYDSGLGFAARGVRAAVVDDLARHSFWRAFGITPDMQVEMENAWPEIAWSEDAPLLSLTNLRDENTTNPLCLLSRLKTWAKP
jgi:hypothetical protein